MGLQPLLLGMAAALAAAEGERGAAAEVERAVRAIQTAYDKGDVDALKRLMTEGHVTTLAYARFSNAADQLKVLSVPTLLVS